MKEIPQFLLGNNSRQLIFELDAFKSDDIVSLIEITVQFLFHEAMRGTHVSACLLWCSHTKNEGGREINEGIHERKRDRNLEFMETSQCHPWVCTGTWTFLPWEMRCSSVKNDNVDVYLFEMYSFVNQRRIWRFHVTFLHFNFFFHVYWCFPARISNGWFFS